MTKKEGTKFYFREWLSKEYGISYTAYTKLDLRQKKDVQGKYKTSKERRHGTGR